LQGEFLETLDRERFLLGNPSSRLMTGNSPAYEALEAALARAMQAEAALVLGSGFAVNSGVLPAVSRRGDLILADKLVHASLIDGLRLCEAGVEWRRFRHNDMEQLAAMLAAAPRSGDGRRTIVVTESLFSMDGDFAPLAELAALQREYGFWLYLDEAHAFGVYGARGTGLLAAYNAAHPEAPLRAEYQVVTFGKALASSGAAVICSEETKGLLVNRMRPLIFSTAMPDMSLLWTRFLLDRLPEFEARRERVRELISIVNNTLQPEVPYGSQIVPIRAGANERALQMAAELREAGFWTTAIRHPTVPQGEARVRVSLCAHHDPSEIERFAKLCRLFG
jgi:8-amino-7-oxononanoate synthase